MKVRQRFAVIQRMDFGHERRHEVHDLIHLADEMIEVGPVRNPPIHFVVGPVDKEIAQPRHAFGRWQIREGDEALAFKMDRIRRE